MAVSSSVTFLVAMEFSKVVLLMLMSSSCTIAAEISNVAPWAPGHIDAHGQSHHADDGRPRTSSADEQRPPSSLSMDDTADHASSHRRHNKNDAPGVRFDMKRRAPSCAGSATLQGSESRSQHLACAIERSVHWLSLLARKKAGVSDWKLDPAFAGGGALLVSIYLGTPPVKADIIIDTSSDLTWIQSKPCKECYAQINPIFDPSKSSTYKKVACSNPVCNELLQSKRCSSSGSCRYVYHDSSSLIKTEGYFSTEALTVDLTTGGKAAVALQFGASDKAWGFYTSQDDGILGLGQGPASLPLQLGYKFGNIFSICPVHWHSNETTSLYFGHAAVPKGEVHYTPIVPSVRNPKFYYIRVVGISVGSTRLPINQSLFEIDSSTGYGGTIVDVAIPILCFLPQVFDHIAAAYKSQVKYPVTLASKLGLNLCFDTAGVKSLPSFPTLEFHFDGGSRLSLPTSNTFVSLENNIFCFAATNESLANAFGVIALQNYDIVYDLENMKIGFSPADCASL